MEFIPRYLAQRFSFFEGISTLKFFILFFGGFFVTAIIPILLSKNIATFISIITITVILINFAGFISVKHFSRKTWIPSNPLIVQWASQTWFNSILSLFSVIRHWGILIFVHILIVMILLVIAIPILQAFAS